MKNIIGNTPMIKINYKYKGFYNKIFVKLEYYNFTGSIKDRVALYMIENARKMLKICKDDFIFDTEDNLMFKCFSAIFTNFVHVNMKICLKA